jgi:hypothetical protein
MRRHVSFIAILKLRQSGAVENTMMARYALGAGASANKVTSLSNYFSRVIYGKVPKVSAEMIGLLATGLGYNSLSCFYADWERVTADLPPNRRSHVPAPGLTPRPFILNVTGGSPNGQKSATLSGARKRSHNQGVGNGEKAQAAQAAAQQNREDQRAERAIATFLKGIAKATQEARRAGGLRSPVGSGAQRGHRPGHRQRARRP